MNGGGPTPDKPAVNLAPPAEPDQVDSFLTLRVADIDAVYREWAARGVTGWADVPIRPATARSL